MSTWRRWLGETQATTQSLATFNSAHESLVRTAKATLPEGEWVGFLSIAMGHLVNPGLSRPLHALSVFYDVERAGAHVLPLGSYSPIPDTRRIPEATWAQPFDFGDAIDLRVEAQRELLADLSRWMPELADVPFAEDDARGGFY